MKTTELEQSILNRRSIRSFTSVCVDRQTVLELIRLGTMAPSGGNMQACRYVLIDEMQLIDRIHAYTPGLNGTPPCLILICTDRDWIQKRNGGNLALGDMACFDVGMAAENIMLGAVEKGIGTCVVRSFDNALIARILRLPETMQPQLMLSIGYPAVAPKAPKRLPLEEIVYYNMMGE